MELALQSHPYFSAAEEAPRGTESASALSASPMSSLPIMVAAVRKDRSSFLDKVAACMLAATPPTSASPTEDAADWDEKLIQGMMQLNRLRRSLAVTSLNWTATLQVVPAQSRRLLRVLGSAVTAGLATAAGCTLSHWAQDLA